MTSIDRRDFLKLLGVVGLNVVVPPWPRRFAYAQTAEEPYDGPLFVSVAARGGWDVTSFCDPKVNVPGEPEINHWSRDSDVGVIPGTLLTFAPFANNQEFFERFHADMLVINGVDAETNSHDAGVRNNFSGRISPGYPAFSAVLAAAYGEELPLPFLTNGGYRETAGLVTYADVDSARDLQDLVDANRVPRRDDYYHDDDELAVIDGYQRARFEERMARPDILPRERRAIENVMFARASREQLKSLMVSLPEQLVGTTDKDGLRNDLLQQAQMAMVCCSAGLTVACDLEVGGFDTHQGHDNSHSTALRRLTNGVLYLWDTAESMGLADRLHVLITSDFGRTPRYNDGAGKDHWPISSAILMKKNAPWGDRVVGRSDEGHNALPIDPTTLEVSTGGGGVILRPAHVIDAVRRLAGIDQHEVARRFPLQVERVEFFGTGI
jgi:hypothetical protein